MERQVDVAVIGAGSAGLFALGQIRKHTENYVLIDGGELGTTCARVGCMPSKALIQVAEDYHRRTIFDREGITGDDEVGIDLADAMEHVQDLRDVFVDRVLDSMEYIDEDKLIKGYAHFTANDTLEVNGDTIKAKAIVIATGSRPMIPKSWEAFSDRILTTDNIFEQEELPSSAAVIGLGVIGLEIGQSLSRMGIEVTGIDMKETVSDLKDPVVNQVAIETLSKEFPMWLGHAADITETEDGKLKVTAGDNSVEVEKLLLSMGRIPNLDQLGLEHTDIELNNQGIPVYNPYTMQVGDLPIFIAGDVDGSRPILHEAAHEGRIAGLNAVASTPTAYKQKTLMAITFCDPNITVVGQQLDELDESEIAIGEMRMGPVGRALIMAKNKGIIRVYADKKTGKLLGATMFTTKGENLAHLLTWCMEMNMTVQDILKMPFYHPVIEEALQAALYNLKHNLEVDITEPVELEPLDSI